jgi:5-methylcytosine-specific restriction protein A
VVVDPQYRARHEATRPSAYARGYTSKWKRESATYLLTFPWCAECQRQGKQTRANVVDHITPHRGDQPLFWNRHNWQPLCKQCHDSKTAREDGGWGKRQAEVRP